MSHREERAMTARATVGRWLLAGVLAVGAVALLVKPGGASKVLGLAMAAVAVTMLVRKDRTSATVLAVVLLGAAVAFLALFLTGNAQMIVDWYHR
ncbi:hypothetical protein GCM10022199_11860 [Marihabitans asiaticum]